NNNILEPFQSAFRNHHSAETSLTRVVNDLLLAIDNKFTSELLLLDLSAAFGTTDHCLLLNRIQNFFVISNLVLSWLKLYLSESGIGNWRPAGRIHVCTVNVERFWM
ncbi:hypothetical protein LDENG_00262950, partial [Lucifuga dentata]